MKCPYNYRSIKRISKASNDLADLETGIVKGCADISTAIFEYAECLMSSCGVWHNGKCEYKK